jgi:hypothetical protein
MGRTMPWTPYPPVWEWEGISKEIGDRAREAYEERAAIIEYDGRQARGPAEARAYCILIDVMHEKKIFTTEHMQSCDVIRQIGQREAFRRHDAIGRRIMAGTWPKRKGLVRTCYLTPDDFPA